jgi:hypothetical protein
VHGRLQHLWATTRGISFAVMSALSSNLDDLDAVYNNYYQWTGVA